MAAATSTGPISIEQINTTFYVWGGGGVGFPTIQAAVDYVRVYNGDLGLVYIVHGHDYSENIATITGGGSAIVILDDRQGANQYWYWNGTQYTPAADVQLAGFVAEGMPLPTTASIAMGFSPTGDFGNGSGNLIVTADPTKGMPSFNLTLDPQDGTGLLTFLRAALNPAGSPRIQMPEALEIYKNTTYPDTYSLWMGQGTDFAGSKGMYVWAKPTENATDFQGQTIGGAYDQTIRLNYLGGDIFLGANASVGEDGTLTAADVTADSITAGAAVFDTCLVDESPVRTFANTADGPSQGMIWPTIGIPVSAGDHWRNPSIDPASLATWPAAGIAVSTGTAWTFSIDPATIPRLNTANTFTAPQTIDGDASVAGTSHLVNGKLRIGDRALGGWDSGEANINTDGSVIVINSGPSGLYLNYDMGDGVAFGNGALEVVANIDELGNANFDETLTCGNGNLRMGDRAAGGWVTGTTNINSDGTTLFINSGPLGLYFNYDMGNGVAFGNGAGLVVGNIDALGNANFDGTLTAAVKNFRIQHPLQKDHDLIHSCLEGPENGVYYRGEVVTANGEAQVTLPLYFEALTYPEDRSVLLTQIFEDDSEAIIGSNTFSMLMASRVKDGKFNIRSSEPIAKVWWEVKAVRKINVDRLEVERLRFIPQSNSQEEREDAANQQRTEQARRRLNDDAHTNAGVVRTGASEAGEPKPEKVRTGGSGPGSSNRTRKPH